MGSVVGRITEETPAYEVLSTGDNFEVRRYAAGTAVEASDANNQAFGALAKYIGVMSKPQNSRSEAISMTAPVVSIPDAGDAMRKLHARRAAGLLEANDALQALVTLDLSLNKIGDDGLRHLGDAVSHGAAPALKTLLLSGNAASDAARQAVEDALKLRS